MKRYLYCFGAIAIFPIWTVCSFVSDNLSELIQWPPLFVMIGAIIGAGIAVFLVVSRFIPAERCAGLAAAISVGLSVLFMMNLFRAGLRAADVYSHLNLFVVSVGAIIVAPVLTYVFIRDIRRLKGLVIVGGIMAATAIWPIVAHIIGSDRTTISGNTPATKAQVAGGPKLPNVYYIIVDAYGRADALKKYAGFDNSRFVRDLQDLGFRTLGGARSNYMKTHMSIPSILAMDYLFTPEGTRIRKWDDIWNIMKGENAVVRRFRELGYRYVYAGGGEWCSKNTDGCILPKGIWNGTTWQLAHNTPIPGVMFYAVPKLYSAVFASQKQLDMADVTGRIGEIVDSDPRAPLFFLYHDLAVHDSIYNADCSLRKELGAEEIDKIDHDARMAASTTAYAETITCINTKLRALVARITNKDRDALIVLTADHGSAFKSNDQIEADAKGLTATGYFDERTSILSSWKLPETCLEKLPEDLGLTNNFRFIFSCVSGQPPNLLANRHFAHRPSPSLGGC